MCRKKIVGKDGAEMVLIPAGDSRWEVGTLETPMKNRVHTVYVDAFYIDVHEVTVGQYYQFTVATGPSLTIVTNFPRFLQRSTPDGLCELARCNGRTQNGQASDYQLRLSGKKPHAVAILVRNIRGAMVPPDGTQCNFADKKWRKLAPRLEMGNWNKSVDDGYTTLPCW